jgi:hypothetical protein
MARFVAITFVLSLVVPACGGVTQRVEPLPDSVRIYNSAVRWQKFQDAASRLPPDQRDDFLDDRDQLAEDLRVDDYEVIRMRTSKDGRRAKVQIKYTWHLDSKGIVRTTHTVQDWQRYGKVWVMAMERQLRGDEMPGFEEDEDDLFDEDFDEEPEEEASDDLLDNDDTDADT